MRKKNEKETEKEKTMNPFYDFYDIRNSMIGILLVMGGAAALGVCLSRENILFCILSAAAIVIGGGMIFHELTEE